MDDPNAGYLSSDSDDAHEPTNWAAESADIDRQERRATRQLAKIVAEGDGSRAHTKTMLGRLQRHERAAKPGPEKEEQEEKDDFMAEMDSELQAQLDARRPPPLPQPSAAAAAGVTSSAPREQYEDLYFDSSEDEERRKQTRKRFTNDELLYDPDQDDEDAAWAQRQRTRHRAPPPPPLPTGLGPSDKERAAAYNAARGLAAVATSDAMLNCPACMSVLCIDCQQHETFLHQFRAMFVMNCIVDRRETLQAAPSRNQQRRARQRQRKEAKAADPAPDPSVDNAPGAASVGVEGPTAVTAGEVNLGGVSAADGPGAAAATMEWEAAEAEAAGTVNPVLCATCNTVVAVYDHDEVFHFFNVLASEA